MGKHMILTGQKFGRLTVLSEAPKRGNDIMWNCMCDCGTPRVVRGADLRNGATKSCGCYSHGLASERLGTHRLTKHPLHCTWGNMLNRCYNPNNHAYYRYGGRGVVMCDEWRTDFKSFYDWSMAHGWSEELTIDRIDNNKGYSPDNCRWVTYKVQANNMRCNHMITYNGQTHTLSEWAD